MPCPIEIESSFGQKLSLDGSGSKKKKKNNKSKNKKKNYNTKEPKSKLDLRWSYVNLPSETATSNATIPQEEEEEEEYKTVGIPGLMPGDTDNDDCDDDYDFGRVDVFGSFTTDELTEAREMGEDPLDYLLYQKRAELSKLGPKFSDAGVSYMREKGHNLELVKPGLFESTRAEQVETIHFNFKAKRADDPNAPVETYFGQLQYYWHKNPAIIVDCCVPVANPAPPMGKRDMQGCEICCERLVHHPVGVAGCKGIDLGHAMWVTPCYEWFEMQMTEMQGVF